MFSFIPDNNQLVLCQSYLFRFKFEDELDEKEWRVGICETLHMLNDIQQKTLDDDKAYQEQLTRKLSDAAYLKNNKSVTHSPRIGNLVSRVNSISRATIPIESSQMTSSIIRNVLANNKNSKDNNVSDEEASESDDVIADTNIIRK